MARSSRYDHVLSEIDDDQAAAAFNRRRRMKLLKELESIDSSPPRNIVVYVSQQFRAISRSDVLPISQMLNSVGVVDNLDFVIQSPGGDGTAAETILDLCRRHCRSELRVIVPMFAKSAATLIALGADEIIMGDTSELGPIDAQISIVQDGAEQQVSADHFLRARNDATLCLKSPDPEIKERGQIQLSLLSPAFLKFCDDAMQFSRDFASKQLRTHMFATDYAADQNLWDRRIDGIVDNLTASSHHLTHGRMITAKDIASDPELQHLKIRELSSTDPYWVKLTEFLLRTEIVMQKNELGKLIMSRGFQLFGG